jgi:hypothetical protein
MGRFEEVPLFAIKVEKGRVGWARRARRSPESPKSHVIAGSEKQTLALINTDDTD